MANGKRILVVDDESSVRDSIKKILEKRGYFVDCSSDAEQAVEKIEQVPYNLVLLDLMMPKINGMDLLKTIRNQYRECNVVMITGYPTLDTATDAISLGAFNYLPKPFTPDELLKVVEGALLIDDRTDFCEKGRMKCKKYSKTGVCKGECALLKGKARLSEKAKEKAEPETMDADLPFKYDEVMMATSKNYADTLSRSDIPIIGHQKYYKKNKDILVVDDEVVICNSVRKILTAGGYNVDYAHTTEDALGKLHNKKYALVLLDLRIPKIGGVELLRQIRETWYSQKVMVITGYASINSAIETTKLGAMSYMPKPFTPEELNKAVGEAMEKVA